MFKRNSPHLRLEEQCRREHRGTCLKTKQEGCRCHGLNRSRGEPFGTERQSSAPEHPCCDEGTRCQGPWVRPAAVRRGGKDTARKGSAGFLTQHGFQGLG